MIRRANDHVADLMARLCSSPVGGDVRFRFECAPRDPGYHDVALPFGMRARLFPLDSIVKGSAAVVVIETVEPDSVHPLDELLLAALPRKAKKLVRGILASMQPWSHPRAAEIEGVFNEVAVALAQEVEAYYDAAFTNTLTSYKDFVSSFSHEALSPIQELRTTLELALAKSSLDTETKSRLRSSLSALDGLRVSLEGMRLLFRDDEKRPLRNQFRRTDLREIIERWVNFYEGQFESKNVQVCTEPPFERWTVECVPEYIEVMVRNLISNGVKYSFDATGNEPPGRFLIKFDRSQQRIAFVNFGVPIPQEDMDSGVLFNRGHRGETATDRGRVGKGVGLYLVKRVAELHGARWRVTSVIQNPGRAHEFARTEFAITFPGPRGGL